MVKTLTIYNKSIWWIIGDENNCLLIQISNHLPKIELESYEFRPTLFTRHPTLQHVLSLTMFVCLYLQKQGFYFLWIWRWVVKSVPPRTWVERATLVRDSKLQASTTPTQKRRVAKPPHVLKCASKTKAYNMWGPTTRSTSTPSTAPLTAAPVGN